MIRAMHTGATGMIGQQFLVDTTANNLANVNTTGFKRNHADFQDLLYASLRQPGTEILQGQSVPNGLQMGNGVRPASTSKIFTAGPLDNTSNPLDLAIEGEGFFQVVAPDGSTRYSRDGAFKLNSENNLVNSDGFRMDPQITIPTDAASIAISPDGTVSVLTASSPDAPTEVGNIQLVRFPNPAGLSAEGNNLFRTTASSGDPVTAEPGQEGMGLLRAGFLERSNVEVVQELVSLILAQRAFEFNSRSVKVADQMLSATNELMR